MKTLKPLILKPSYYEEIEKEIIKFFNDTLYRELFKIINKEKELTNSKDYISDAIKNGIIEYDGLGNFTGKFNSTLSRELIKLGAKYNAVKKSYFLDKTKIPASISLAKAHADSIFDDKQRKIMNALNENMIYKKLQELPLFTNYEKVISMVEADFQSTLKYISIPVVLTPEMKKIIAEQWSNNLKLYIKSWTDKNIIDLREKVQKNAYSGQRAQNMVNLIQNNYEVSKNKAKFLAKQETSLFMSKYRETRYKDAGILKYKWSTSHDERVRDDHKILNGKIFDWDNPPVVDRKTGQKAHPSEYFGCRCVAIPVID